jgi:mannitol-1-/sugar-/sorbitol-6-phosphatase
VIRAILSDLDGVLVDSAAAVDRAWRSWARGHGLDPDLVLAGIGDRPTAETIRALAPHLDAAAEGERLDAAQAADTKGVVALPAARELLDGTIGLPVAVVTSCTAPLARARLEAAGLPLPEILVTADQLRRGKPHPDGYLLAAERVGEPPEACVVVEDAPAGVRAGRAAGTWVVAVLTTHDAPQLAAASARVRDLSALPGWLATRT